MPDFTAGWLELRAPADAAARSLTLVEQVRARLSGRPVVRVVDLATGTGANLRYLLPRLPIPQRWTLIDNDPALLAVLASRLAADGDDRPDAVAVSIRYADLAGLPPDLVADAELVTASALLDLASTAWLERLSRACAAASAVALFALNYDGRMSMTPPDPHDQLVRDLVNRHQSTDKGFGPAAGPGASAFMAYAFAAAGYEVVRERSDWQLGPDDRDLQGELIAGWASAASAIAPTERERVARWRARREEHLAARRSSIIVGHDDLAAWPAERSR
jgi:hypothetical protein